MILEVHMELETLLQPSMENTPVRRPPTQLLRGRPWHNEAYFFFCLQACHVFSNLRKGVCFVSFEHWVRDIDFCSQPYIVYLFNSSVIVRVRLS